MADDDFVVCPFSVVQDSNEGAPFGFRGLRTPPIGKDKIRKPIVIPVVKKAMYLIDRNEWGVGLADYSICGLEYEVQIERKSISDLFSTLSKRRDDFEREIARLNTQCQYACVMIEGSFGHISSSLDHGPAPSSVIGTILAWSQRYPKVHWITAGSRDMAERITFRILERYWNDREEKAKKGRVEVVEFEKKGLVMK